MMASSDEMPSEDSRRLLECQICLCSMVGRKPRGLNCLHTFCETCLNQLPCVESKITCPTCRGQTKLPANGASGLPANFLIEQLATKLHQINLCQTCVENDGSSNQAVFYCSDGCGRLCNSCKASHDSVSSFKEHQVKSPQTSEEISSKHCLAHNKVIGLFCEKCKTCLCSTCALSSKHRGHEDFIVEIIKEYERLGSKIKAETKAIQDACIEKLSSIQTEEEAFKKITEKIKTEHQRRIKVLDDELAKLLTKVKQVSAPLMDFREKLEMLRDGAVLISGRVKSEEMEKCPRKKMLEIMQDEAKCKDFQKEMVVLKKPYVKELEFLVSTAITELGKVSIWPVKVGDKVRIRRDILNPTCGWGMISHDSIGTVTNVTGKYCTINFPEQTNWNGATDEMEILSS